MSREAVSQIIERAVRDDEFFQLLQDQPDQAIQGYDLDDTERRAFEVRAYNVVVRTSRRELQEKAQLHKPAPTAAPYAPRPADTTVAAPAAKRGRGLGALIAVLAVLVIAGGSGAFRYMERQWPWQAAGLGKQAAPARIPSPALGARPKSSPPGSTSNPSASAATPRLSSPRPSSAPASGLPSASAQSEALRVSVEKAYFEQVGQPMLNVLKSFGAVLVAVRADKDPTKDLTDLSGQLADLKQRLGATAPPQQLNQQHKTLEQAIPLLESDTDQLKAAVGQKNTVQAILIATEMEAIFNQLQDLVTFANAPHPDFYQPISTTQQLSHALNFDVISQNVTQRNGTAVSVLLRIALRSTGPSPDEVTDSLHHGVIVARQSYPQASQVRVVGFTETNATVGSQVGTADWYCGPGNLPPNASSSSKWQDYCGKVFITAAGSSTPTAVSY